MGATGENAGRITVHGNQVQEGRAGCAWGLACNPDVTGELGGVFKREYLGSRKSTQKLWGDGQVGTEAGAQSPWGDPQQSHQRDRGPEQGQ